MYNKKSMAPHLVVAQTGGDFFAIFDGGAFLQFQLNNKLWPRRGREKF
jgi:hypothetical protein